jgi:hypothetical protein
MLATVYQFLKQFSCTGNGFLMMGMVQGCWQQLSNARNSHSGTWKGSLMLGMVQGCWQQLINPGYILMILETIQWCWKIFSGGT